MNLIPLVSHPRSGSTFLANLLAKSFGLKVLMEPFHTSNRVRAAALKGILNDHPGIIFDRDTWVSGCRVQPLTALHQLSSHLVNNSLCFKLFPGHLGPLEQQDIFSQSKCIVVLKRNLLHSYLSDVIATRTGKYTNQDSSQERVDFEFGIFYHWAKLMQAHINHALQFANENNIPTIVVHYEDLLKDRELVLGQLHHFLGESGNFNQDVVSSFQRQDRRSSALEKVINPDELLEALERINAQALVDSDSSMKLVDESIFR